MEKGHSLIDCIITAFDGKCNLKYKKIFVA